MRIPAFSAILVVLVGISTPLMCAAQPPASRNPPRTIFRDSDGNLISNNEFVEIRMANFHYSDATVVNQLEDGTVEFRLQKVPQEGMQAPDFSVRTLDGKVLSSKDIRGKVIVLNFWFIGCAVCRAHKPMLNELKAEFAGRDDIMFLAMTGDPAGEVRKFLEKEPFTYLHAADAKTVMDAFVFSGYPKNIVVGKNGKIVYWRSTIKAWEKFEAVIRTELAR